MRLARGVNASVPMKGFLGFCRSVSTQFELDSSADTLLLILDLSVGGSNRAGAVSFDHERQRCLSILMKDGILLK
jgi:hypothetical protein